MGPGPIPRPRHSARADQDVLRWFILVVASLLDRAAAPGGDTAGGLMDEAKRRRAIMAYHEAGPGGGRPQAGGHGPFHHNTGYTGSPVPPFR